MNNKIKFWLGRVNEEFIKKTQDLSKDILVKQYQILNFDDMRLDVQEQVIEQLHGDMLNLGWIKEATDLENEFNKKNKVI